VVERKNKLENSVFSFNLVQYSYFMKYDKIDTRLFIENRKRFVKKMKPNAVAVFTSNAIMPKSADAGYNWRQNPDLFYLTGIDQEETYLILFPDAPKPEWKEILFVRETSEHIAVWEGKKHNKAEATAFSGVKNVHWSAKFEQLLNAIALQAKCIYLNANENDRADGFQYTAETELAKAVRAKFPLHTYERSAPIMHDLRAQKSEIEIDLLRKAIDITNKGFHRALSFVKPGVWEYEVEAEITYEYLRNRGTGHAYTPIVASGGNACVLHYITNSMQCKDGDLLLMDCGAEYANYCADLTRTIPVNGRFSKRQKEVYNAVLRVHNEAKKMMKAGMVLNDFNRAVEGIMEKELVDLKLLKLADVKKQDKNNPLLKKYFPHGTAHFLGIDVHDVGNRYAKLKAGAVLTCEPGIYIQEENIGIRIENNIVVTNGKPIDLMANVPIEVEEIETLMNKKK
jgi:Xaa-Pro aminopeptidase